MKYKKILKEVGIMLAILLGAGIISGYIDVTPPKKAAQTANGEAKVIEINDEQFAQLIFDYKSGKEWQLKGDMPVVIDFYATWCPPCKRLRPRLEQLASEYGGQVVVYSVDAELYPQLAAYMGVESFPTLFFVPMNGKPYKSVGLAPLHQLRSAVEKILKNE